MADLELTSSYFKFEADIEILKKMNIKITRKTKIYAYVDIRILIVPFENMI